MLKQLGQAANGLANQRGQNLQITSCSPLYAAVSAAGLHRACSHLLEIALQHTPKGGYVRADAMRAPCGGVLIIIEDNGSNPLVSFKIGQSSFMKSSDYEGNLIDQMLQRSVSVTTLSLQCRVCCCGFD